MCIHIRVEALEVPEVLIEILSEVKMKVTVISSHALKQQSGAYTQLILALFYLFPHLFVLTIYRK